ncbi:MAG: 16S rRNA (cytosine(1402)-N(4))-methyltransferase [Pelagibacteraceae bacterium TMED287]|nr:MAG: 16S rRNA (cytosine(1402)-N(4))-methyltransferase [Pelagibacteraceae bacterium TMED287]|tara:strand:- start:1544 stop:2560 length:1017 start_codon:yes stop_codon:yes gene_type:complete
MNLPQSSLEPQHFPVMLKEVIRACSPEEGGHFVDCTFGAGGYSAELLKFPNINITALDRDKETEKKAKNLKKKYFNRFSFFNEKFSNLDKIINTNKKVDAIIFDLGISSLQLLDMSRGFSFKCKDKIDMNMGLSSISAEEVINELDEDSLKLIIKMFGDEKEASKIVKNIVIARKTKKISKVSELVKIIEKSKKRDYSKKINVCTKTFQALRIFVNKETTELIEGIIKASRLVKSGGKIVIVSFHSIEDKIVKFFFKNYSKNKSKPSRYLPDDKANSIILFEEYKNNLIKPSKEEILNNPPSRSAKLRFIIRSKNNFCEPANLKIKFKKYLDLERINV